MLSQPQPRSKPSQAENVAFSRRDLLLTPKNADAMQKGCHAVNHTTPPFPEF